MNPQYRAGLERARGRQSDDDVFEAIAKSIKTGSPLPLLAAILHGGRQTPSQPDNPPLAPLSPEDTVEPIELYGQQHPNEPRSSVREAAHNRAQSAADGHWVTIAHRHVLIQEPRGDGLQSHKQPEAKPLPPSGEASIYSDIFEGEKTSNGDIFHQNGYTGALLPRDRWHAVPLGTRVELTHGGKSVVVEINDRGAGDRNPNSTRAIDLSRAAASVLVGRKINGDEDARNVGLIHLDAIKIVPKDTPLGPAPH